MKDFNDGRVLIQRIAAEVAVELSTLDGQAWAIQPEPEDSYNDVPKLDTCHGDTITLRLDWQTHSKMTVSIYSHGLNEFLPYNVYWPSIGVGTSKPAATIAKDICRRLLPAYREVRAQAEERKRLTEDSEALEQGIMDSLAGIVGITPRNRRQASFGLRGTHTWYGDFEVSSYQGGSITLKLHSMPVEAAQHIFRILKEYS